MHQSKPIVPCLTIHLMKTQLTEPTRSRGLQPTSVGGKGGGRDIAPCLTSERIGGARSARRPSKALNERILIQSQNFPGKVIHRVKVMAKVKADSYRLIGCRNLTRDSCKPKPSQNAQPNANGGMTKMPCKRLMLSTGQGKCQVK